LAADEMRKGFTTSNRQTLSIFFAVKIFCMILKFARLSYSCFAANLTRDIGTSPIVIRQALISDSVISLSKYRPTIDRIENLTISSSSSALFDLRIINLQQLVEPLEELGS
jgi:hypothetical protein